MEEIETRLRESTDAFIKSFENWVAQSKNLESREGLMEAMHEVRKVVSRVEIEIAISERDRLGSRPLPIPSHRSQRRANNEGGEGEEVDYNTIDDGNDGPQPESNAEAQPRRSSGGGDRRPRRPMQNRGDRGNNNNQQGQ